MPHPTVPCVVRHPITGQMIALDPGLDYADDDLLLVEYPWAFKPIEDAHEVIESVVIEQATAAPGERRNRRK